MRGVLGAFRELDSVVEAIEELKQQKYVDIYVYTPTPRHELEHAVHPPTSPAGKPHIATSCTSARRPP